MGDRQKRGKDRQKIRRDITRSGRRTFLLQKLIYHWFYVAYMVKTVYLLFCEARLDVDVDDDVLIYFIVCSFRGDPLIFRGKRIKLDCGHQYERGFLVTRADTVKTCPNPSGGFGYSIASHPGQLRSGFGVQRASPQQATGYAVRRQTIGSSSCSNKNFRS